MELKRRKILVTGAGGFIGSHLVERLIKEDCYIKAFVFYNAINLWGWLESFKLTKTKGLEVVPGDIRDYQRVREIVKDVAIIFHLAALKRKD